VKTITFDRTYGDSTGRFPWTSISGAQYMLVLYTEDANYIHVEPMQNRKASEYIRAYGRALDFFKRYDIKPSILRMDNEISNALESYLVDTRQVPIQYVAPITIVKTRPKESFAFGKITSSLSWLRQIQISPCMPGKILSLTLN
jgi:cation diffusion facilitator CzcD-associated flavoprotein CzcO